MEYDLAIGRGVVKSPRRRRAGDAERKCWVGRPFVLKTRYYNKNDMEVKNEIPPTT
jgi:hypothetical protein